MFLILKSIIFNIDEHTYIILIKYDINRSFGAQVSWASTVSIGSSFAESDENITHQIVDRPNVDKKYLSRFV